MPNLDQIKELALQGDLYATQTLKDAARYRWLKNEGKAMSVDSFSGKYRVVDMSVNLVVTDWLDSFDEAIDAAMNGE